FSKSLWDRLSADRQATLQKAADDACVSISDAIVENENQLVDFFKEQGLKVYEPDVDAFRTRVQQMYLESEFSKDWPDGLLDRINAVE
ncbi:MAG TPA: C4-dicarboxylate ABC transporter, partial [Devosia sp.]|nr:C4-dicarboxylate ABC transporter [Devosia sp.]